MAVLLGPARWTRQAETIEPGPVGPRPAVVAALTTVALAGDLMSTSQPSPPLSDAVVTAEDGAHADATLRRSIGRGVAWATVSNLVMRMSGIAVTAVVARLLSPTEFGTFAVALAVFVVVTSLAELGMASAVARSPLEPSDIAGTVTSISIIVSMALASLMAATAQPLASLLGTPEAAEAIRILALCSA